VAVVGGRYNPGTMGEQIAACYLILKGYRIIERNFRSGHLEIDLVVHDGDCLVFVEVKTRRGNSFGGAIAAVVPRKISNMRRAARGFLDRLPGTFMFREIRFDLIAIDIDARNDTMVLRHVKGIP